jgi:NTP pyrophosphatase (non-canonical NTP hydrolase)
MNLNELGRLSNENAHAHGWYDEPNPIPQQIALMHSELSEALECYRDGHMAVTVTEKGKPMGFPTELADVIIRVVDTACEMGIDLDEVVRQKMAYNKTRPFKHARKVL